MKNELIIAEQPYIEGKKYKDGRGNILIFWYYEPDNSSDDGGNFYICKNEKGETVYIDAGFDCLYFII